MNGFLVIARMTMDDVPLRFFEDQKIAEEFVDRQVAGKEAKPELHQLVDDMAAKSEFPTTGLIGLSIVAIVGGCPVSRTRHVEFV